MHMNQSSIITSKLVLFPRRVKQIRKFVFRRVDFLEQHIVLVISNLLARIYKDRHLDRGSERV